MPSMRPDSSSPSASSLPDVQALAGMGETEIRALAVSLIEQAQRGAKQALLDAATLASLNTQLERDQIALRHSQAKIDALTHELRLLRHWKFAPKSEILHADQRALFEQAREEDIAALEQEIQAIDQAQQEPPAKPERPRVQPMRNPLPEHLPRVDVAHEPAGFDAQSGTCPCGCGATMVRIGQDVSEKLDYVPGSLRVERHVRGRWACRACARVSQEAMPAHVIDKGLPTEALLAQVIIAKHDDHLPLYRQSEMLARQGVDIARSSLSQWAGAVGQALLPLVAALKQEVLGCGVLHVDESPLKVLSGCGDAQRGYIWAFSPARGQSVQAVIYEVAQGRAGEHARRFLGRHPSPAESPPAQGPEAWSGHLMVDDYAGYKALFAGSAEPGALSGTPPPIIELACWAHARRKFHDLHVANQSPMAAQALMRIARLYAVEAEIVEQGLDSQQAQAHRAQRSLPELQALKAWMLAQRQQMTNGTASAKALDYSLRRWDALQRYAHSGDLPIDNNPIERLIRPWALGRKNWLFAGSLKAAQRAAAIMSLIESAKLNGLEPQAYLTDVLKRLPTQLNRHIHELLPTQWKAQGD